MALLSNVLPSTRGNYQADRRWSDQFIPQLRALIGPHLLVPSSLEQDRHEAADLVVLTGRDLTIACRLRRHGYAKKYPNQFTIRSRRDSGITTELEKIRAGWGDWLFYGHIAENNKDIAPWWIIDLSVFRASLSLNELQGVPHYTCDANVPNFDGTLFNAYYVQRFPSALVVASSN